MKEHTAPEGLLMRCVPEGNKEISKMISLFVTECGDLSTTLRKKTHLNQMGRQLNIILG